jgi:hypothetical protein
MQKAVELLVSAKGNLKPVNTVGKEQENNQPQRGAAVLPRALLSDTMSELSVCSTISTKLSVDYITVLAKTQASLAPLFSKLRKAVPLDGPRNKTLLQGLARHCWQILTHMA